MREGVGREGVGRLTAVLGAVMASGPLAINMYLPALPSLESEYGVDAARVQQTLAAYLLGLAFGQLAYGPLADRYGRKRPLMAGLLIYALASAGCAVAQTIDSFIALRFAQALGGAASMVVIRAIIRDRFDAIQSARVLSLMMMIMGVAPIVAPLAGGWLLLNGSWHTIFWLLSGYAVICALLVGRFLDESLKPGGRTASLSQAAGGFLTVGGDLRFLGPTLVFVSAFGAFFAYLAAAPFVFIQYFGVRADHFGLYYGANALGFIVFSQLNGRLVARHGPRRVLFWGVSLLAGSSALLLAVALTGFGGFPGMLAGVFLMVSSLGFIASNASVIAMQPFGRAAGGASSLLGSGQSLFGVVASAAVGWMGARGLLPMATVVFACAALSFVFCVLLVRPERTSP